ncbi:hypothetical protein ABPG73_002428 [Tetrahymena malaccensis]
MSQTNVLRQSASSGVVRKFEEMRQSIQLKNSIQEVRQSQEFQHPKTDLEEGNKHQHFNCELVATTAKTEAIILNTNVQTVQSQTANKNKKLNKDEKQKQDLADKVDHKISLDELRLKYQTDYHNGLTEQQAQELLKTHGENRLTVKQGTPLWVKLLKEMTNGFSLMLWVSAILCFIAQGLEPNPSNIYLAVVLIIVILITTAITFQQNAKSEALMNSFKNFIPAKTIVIRGGETKQIEAAHLVVGDIVIIRLGEKIPADIRILESNEMKVDNSPLTGESEPLLRTAECSHPESYIETSNIAFFGTLCKEGNGKGIVICTGDRTMLGQIADLSSGEKKVKTPLRIELDRFVVLITVIAIVLGVAFFLLAWLYMNYKMTDCLVFGIGILVANVPEGLLGCITISLAITAKNLSAKNVLVKNLEAVETLGSTSCICSDKTGTLTQNVMSVKNLWYSDQIHLSKNKAHLKQGEIPEYDTEDPDFKTLQKAAMLSSEARFDTSTIKEKDNIDYLTCPVLGDATETGIIRFYQYIDDVNSFRERYRVAKNPDGTYGKMPFNSQVKFALTIIEEQTQDSDYTVYIKGAPEKIWSYCSSVIVNGRPSQLNEVWQKKFKAVNLTFGKGGERVLGFAKLSLPAAQFPQGFIFNVSSIQKFPFKLANFQFCGLISLMDPPKQRVPHAILECRSAGVKVIMVTGDQPPTAAAIAKEIASGAGHLGYYIAFNYFGFPVLSLFGLASATGYRPIQNDFGTYYNPILQKYDPYYNAAIYNITKFQDCNKLNNDQNTALSNLQYSLDWFTLSEGNYDLRKSLVKCDPQTGAFIPWIHWSDCDINKSQNWSVLTSQTACYSVEAINYAQSVYFLTIVLLQWTNVFACKSRSMSFTTTAFNSVMIQGVIFETLLVVFLQYVPGVQTVFGGRPMFFWLWTSCLAYTMLLLVYDELRKFCCRKNKWFYKYCYW